MRDNSFVSKNQKSFERKKSAEVLDDEYYDEEYYDEEDGSPTPEGRRKSTVSKQKSIEVIEQKVDKPPAENKKPSPKNLQPQDK